MKKFYILRSAAIRQNACNDVNQAPDDWMVRIDQPKRNLEQSAKFHAMCGELAKQAEHLGRKFTMEQWKHLIVSAHAIETKEDREMIPGLAGEFLNIRESTAQMSMKRMASLIEFAYAIGADKGVRFSE